MIAYISGACHLQIFEHACNTGVGQIRSVHQGVHVDYSSNRNEATVHTMDDFSLLSASVDWIIVERVARYV